MKKWIIGFTTLAFFVQSNAQQALSIDEAWQYAVDHNVNVQKAKIDRTIADHKVKETIGIGLPQISAQGQYNYFLNIPVQLLPAAFVGGEEGTYIPVQFGQKQSVSGGVTLTQLLFNGSYLVGLQSAKAYKETAALAEEKTEITVKEAILLTYTGILVTDENLKTLEENRKVAEKSLFDTEQTYKVGLIELQNVEQQQYSYKSILTNQQNLIRTRDKLLMTLKYLMGYPLKENLVLTTDLQELIVKNETLVSVEENRDVSNHIDFRLSQNALRLQQLLLKLQKSKYLPTLAAAVSSTYNGNADDFNFFNKNQQYFNTSVIALQLDIPIFSGFQKKWQTEQAKLEVKKAELDLNETQRNIQNTAFTASIEYENAYNSYKNAQELVALSSSIFKKQQIKFQEGLGTSLELQQAETQLYSSQNQYYEAALNLIQSKTKLDKALGTL